MPHASDASRDFDFEIGTWRVSHRRLRERLAQSDDWEEFTGTCNMQTVLGGLGNIEDNLLMFPSGAFRAIAIRSYDPATSSWAIWWLSSNDPHQLDVPVIGQFQNGLGAFFAEDTLRGLPIKVRFLWKETDTPMPRWEQAMSDDGGATWETNWTMDFERA